MDILDYVREHMVLQIGCNLSAHICSEVLVDDPKELVHTIVHNGGYISAISWWERVSFGSKPQMGYGGMRDPRASEEFYFAETDIGKNFPVGTTECEYLNYLAQTLKSHSDVSLMPAFEICKEDV